MSITLVSYNIQYGFGIDGLYDLERIAATVENGDILLLQEVTRGFPMNGGVDMPAAIRARFAGRFVAEGLPAEIALGATPQNSELQRFQFGNMIVSRWPILSVRNHLLPRVRRDNRLNLQRGALEALIETPAGVFTFFSVHLDHIDAEERLKQIRALRQIAAASLHCSASVTGLGAYGLPELPQAQGCLIGGDFNMKPGSAEYVATVEASEIGATMVDVTAGDPGNSFFNPKEVDSHQRLDYIFADPVTAARTGECRIDRTADGSDHLPVIVTF